MNCRGQAVADRRSDDAIFFPRNHKMCIRDRLYALPLLMDDSGIHLTTEIESKPYIELTREVQELFGVHSAWRGNIIDVFGRQGYSPRIMEIEGDYSHACLLYTSINHDFHLILFTYSFGYKKTLHFQP